MIVRSKAEILIERRFDGVTTAEEEAELDALLVADSRVAGLFVERASFEAQLEAALRESAPEPIRANRPRLPRVWMAATGAVVLASVSVLFVAHRGWRSPASVAAVNFPDGSRASLEDGARVSLRPGGADLEVDLLGGAARFEVAHRSGHHFRVHVGTVTVEVVGTSFEVRPGARDVAVTVARGRVHVTAPGRDAYLDSGMAARFMSDAPRGAAPGTPQGIDPTEKDASPPKEQASPRVTPLAASAWARAAERKDYSGAYRLLSHVGIGTVRDDPAELFLAADVARLSGHPDQALLPLRRLLEGHARDPRAPYAAFILGRVLLEELHQPHDAALAFARVRELNPATPLASDALAREVLAWARAGDNEQARQRADEYVRAYPNGARLREIRRFANTP
jgi:transmembrane sensor